MQPGAEAPLGRRARRRLLGALFASGVLALILTACGISFGADSDESEIFEDLTIDGELTAGGFLTLTLEYEQPYPVAVRVACVLLAAEEKTKAIATPIPVETPARGAVRPNTVLHILSETLPAVGTPQTWSPAEATPEPGTIQRSFSLPDLPGRYRIKCLTPADERNKIERLITVAAGPGPTATATP